MNLVFQPFFLYQVRPFKPVERASFRLEKNKGTTIPIGITAPEGNRYKVLKNIERKLRKGVLLNPENDPVVHIADLRHMWAEREIPNLQANLMTHLFGCLAHGDIAAIRRANFSAYGASGAHLRGKEDFFFDDLKDGDWIRLYSDGKGLIIEKE